LTNVLRIKRRNTGIAGAPTALASGEIAYNEVDGKLYYGFGNDGLNNATSIVPIAGVGAFLPLSGGTLTGPLTLAADPTANLHAATKQYADGSIARSEVTGDWEGTLVRRAPTDGHVRLGLGSTVAQFLSNAIGYPADGWYRVAAFSTGTGCALIHVTSVTNVSWDTQVRTLLFTWWSGAGGAWGYSLANLGGHGTNLCQQYGVSPNVNLDMQFVGASRAIEARVLLLAGDDPGVYGYGGTTIPLTSVVAPVTPIAFPAIVT
jgi:hypothetical protein